MNFFVMLFVQCKNVVQLITTHYVLDWKKVEKNFSSIDNNAPFKNGQK